jgi:wyosine [tRNA(Phe)-imidazoG37] synthetase (radical SAM superfamily)
MTQLLKSAGPLESAERALRPTGVENNFLAPPVSLDNRFVDAVLSPSARGLTVVANLAPDKNCDLDCVHCEVNRAVPPATEKLDVDVMGAELLRILTLIHANHLCSLSRFAGLPPELLVLRHVTLGGDGEPTLCPEFTEALREVIHVRALGRVPFFKLVLLTNGSGFSLPPVRQSLRLLTSRDEIWIKLDAGSPQRFEAVNRPAPGVTYEGMLSNIRIVGRERPIVIQSLFSSWQGIAPGTQEIEEYAARLAELKAAGVQISLVQIHSATRPAAGSQCGHLSLKVLAGIAQVVRRETGLPVQVY